MSYTPKPIDTSSSQLPVGMNSLMEQLAESTHDTWAIKRLEDGWSYGPNRDDVAKHHPCLIPYSELPESEKEYDRKIVSETLKAVYALGYDIQLKDALSG